MRLCGHAITTMIARLHGPALKELQILSEHYEMRGPISLLDWLAVIWKREWLCTRDRLGCNDPEWCLAFIFKNKKE